MPVILGIGALCGVIALLKSQVVDSAFKKYAEDYVEFTAEEAAEREKYKNMKSIYED